MVRIVRPSDITVVQPSQVERPTNVLTPPSTPKRIREISSSPGSKSPLNSENSSWVKENQRQIFIEHLRQWSLNHDTSLHLNGFINVRRDIAQSEPLILGKSISCTLTQPSPAGDYVRHIVIRLFAPRRSGKYRLVVRSGASWVSARESFDKHYFAYLEWKRILASRNKSPPIQGKEDSALEDRDPDSVAVQPSFHKFSSLPFELQLCVLEIAFGKETHYYPGKDKGPGFATYNKMSWGKVSLRVDPSPTKLSDMLSISKYLNRYLISWVYRSIDFAFGCQGLTNFLWLSGPQNRKQIKRMTLVFGSMALVHSIRWMSPDPVYELFDPRPIVNPPALQVFWRFSIRDLAKDIHLSLLTIDLDNMTPKHLPLVVGSLRDFFGSVECIRFTCRGNPVDHSDARLTGVHESQSWREICRDIFLKYRNEGPPWYSIMSYDRQRGSTEDFDSAMKASHVMEFFASKA